MPAHRPDHLQAPTSRQHEVATAVHELRTPLATVRGFIETLLARGDELSADVERHMLQIAQRNTVLLGQRIDTLLDHERLTTGHVHLVRRPVVVADVVAEIVEDCAGLLTDHPVEVAVDPQVLATVDTVALAHVLGNLLSNAAKHSPAGAPITVRAHVAEDETVPVEVVDRGTGIDQDDLDRVFDPFFRVQDGPSGMGLGLSVVQRYVALWGGRITIDSTPGEGTAVRFTLPRADGTDGVVDLVDEVELAGTPRT